MQILNTNEIKEKIIKDLESYNFKNKLLLLSKNPSAEVIYYKNAIIKRCEQFGIEYVDKEFSCEDEKEILSFINSYDEDDGFIILSPFDDDEDLDLLKREIKLRDLDSFTYKNLGQTMEGVFEALPATSRSIIRFLDTLVDDYRSKTITIANRTNIIGKPLAMYLSSKGATVTILNSTSKNPKSYIQNSDIFISAIGKANFYDKSFFKEGSMIIDVGTSYINGKILGDIDYKTLDDMDLAYLGSKAGIGAITTITLVEGLKY